ncbi:MAG TPA: OmpA family protein [Bacteroidales bacterium]|nr:OmpA family protein [Bacteroidales bacterium]
MKNRLKLLASICLVILFIPPLSAQKIDFEKKLKKKVVQRADKRTDQGIDKGLDAFEKGVKDAATEKKDDKTAEDKNASKTSDNKNAATSTEKKEPAGTPNETPALASYSKYDFVPGEKIIVFEDFSQDAVGDFPALWYTNGSGEIVTLNNYPGKWLMMRERSEYAYMFNNPLPDNYTIEFDYIRQNCKHNSNSTTFYLISVPKGKNAFESITYPGMRMDIRGVAVADMNNFGVDPMEKVSNFRDIPLLSTECGKVIKVSIWVQKQRMRLYFNEEKVYDIPRMFPKDKPINVFRISKHNPDKQDFISNVRVAIGAPDLRNKLLTEGKLVTYGILFDTGSDKVKPESYGTIKSIADVLKENPDVKVKIIGHTDADGDDAKNLDLSKRRAASVKNELVNSFDIDGARISTDGKGESQPVASNDTPANKAQNRRVEFVKL